jgi:hypothetical protein
MRSGADWKGGEGRGGGLVVETRVATSCAANTPRRVAKEVVSASIVERFGPAKRGATETISPTAQSSGREISFKPENLPGTDA